MKNDNHNTDKHINEYKFKFCQVGNVIPPNIGGALIIDGYYYFKIINMTDNNIICRKRNETLNLRIEFYSENGISSKNDEIFCQLHVYSININLDSSSYISCISNLKNEVKHFIFDLKKAENIFYANLDHVSLVQEGLYICYTTLVTTMTIQNSQRLPQYKYFISPDFKFISSDFFIINVIN